MTKAKTNEIYFLVLSIFSRIIVPWFLTESELKSALTKKTIY